MNILFDELEVMRLHSDRYSYGELRALLMEQVAIRDK